MKLFKKHYPYFLLSTLLLGGKVSQGQIVKQQIIPVSGLGAEKSQLGWYRDKAQKGISIFVQGTIKGELWTIDKQSFANFVDKHKEKSGLGKMFNNMAIDNMSYVPHQFTKVRKINLDNNLDVTEKTDYLFHSSISNTDTLLHIGRFAGLYSLNQRDENGFKDGEMPIKFNLSDYTAKLPELPLIGDTLSTEINIVSEG